MCSCVDARGNLTPAALRRYGGEACDCPRGPHSEDAVERARAMAEEEVEKRWLRLTSKRIEVVCAARGLVRVKDSPHDSLAYRSALAVLVQDVLEEAQACVDVGMDRPVVLDVVGPVPQLQVVANG